MNLTNLSFASPWLLLALLILPALWYLLRLTPPPPKSQVFGPFALLHDLIDRNRRPQSPPWWFWLIRLGMFALIVFALAELVSDPGRDSRPAPEQTLVVLVEDSGAAMAHWPAVIDQLRALAEERRTASASTYLLLGSALDKGGDPNEPPQPVSPLVLETRLGALSPQAYPLKRAYESAVSEACGEACTLILFSDGQNFSKDEAPTDPYDSLRKLPSVKGFRLVMPPQDAPLIGDLRATNQGLDVTVKRGITTYDLRGLVRAYDDQEQVLSESALFLEAGVGESDISLPLADALRNKVRRLALNALVVDTQSSGIAAINLEPSAASTLLLPQGADFWRVAFISSRSESSSGRLSSAEFYLRQALVPFADITDVPAVFDSETVSSFFRNGLSTLFIFNAPLFNSNTLSELERYVDEGGQIIWIGGPDLGSIPVALAPVALRERALTRGGTFEWAAETSFGEPSPEGPLADFHFNDDLIVKGQNLPEPGPETEGRTWLRAADGSPLITGVSKGKGQVIFLHSGLTPDWSSLVFDESFLPLMKRLLSLSGLNLDQEGVVLDKQLQAVSLMEPSGRLKLVDRPVPPLLPATQRLTSARVPPGLYGEGFQRESLSYSDGHGEPLAVIDENRISFVPLYSELAQSFKGWLLLLAFIALLVDGAIMAVRSLIDLSSRRVALAGFILLFGLTFVAQPQESAAQIILGSGETAIARETDIGYVLSGEPSLDRRTRLGVETLLMATEARTTFKGGKAVVVDFSQPAEALASLPLVYWPLRGNEEKLNETKLSTISLYLKNGGMIVFDSRDYLRSTESLTTPAKNWLIDLHKRLAIPPLRRAPDYHVIARSFYILPAMTGRLGQGRYWVTDEPNSDFDSDSQLPRSDGISPIVVVESDMAGLWAEAAQPLRLTRGLNSFAGNSDWESAIRGGVNLVLYALTGNYKADQVHVAKILSLIGK